MTPFSTRPLVSLQVGIGLAVGLGAGVGLAVPVGTTVALGSELGRGVRSGAFNGEHAAGASASRINMKKGKASFFIIL